MSGNLHPITTYMRQTIKIFKELGFDIYEGPEVDT